MQTVQPIDFRRARKENFSTCWDFAFEIMNEPLYFSVSSESVNNPNCRTCLPCACVGNFPISLVSLAMLSEIYHGLGKVSVNNRLNFATLFIITISLRPAQNTVTPPCWKRVSPARGWRRVYTGLLAFGPPWKIEIVFSQVFGLLLMVTMISHHHHQLWFRSEILKYGVSNLPMAEKRAFERNDGPISWFVIFFIKIWIGDIYDICLLIFVFLILEDLWT